MRNHSDERLDKIKELGNELIEYECMADSVLADVKAVTDRWDTLQHQVSYCYIAPARCFQAYRLNGSFCMYYLNNFAYCNIFNT